MGVHQADKRKGCATLLFDLVFMPAGAMFVAELLLLTLILVGDSRPVAIRQGIEGLEPSLPGYPLALAGDCALFGIRDGRVGLFDGLIQSREEAGVVPPFARTQSIPCGKHKTRPIFLAVFDQQAMPPRRLLFARDQFAELSSGLFKAQLRKLEQGLERECASHG